MDCPPLYGEPSGASEAAGAAEEALVLVEALVDVFVLEEALVEVFVLEEALVEVFVLEEALEDVFVLEEALEDVFVLEEDRLVLLEVFLVEDELLLGADVTEMARVVVEVACLLTKTCAELQPKSVPVVWPSKIAFMMKGYACHSFESNASNGDRYGERR